MKFSKYVCWKSEMIRKVMDVEATHPEDHIFLATHSPLKMYRQSLTEAQSKVTYDEEKFLKDFLATPDFAFVPVLGTSGTGKSHLIRWLYTRIRSIRKTSNYRVLLIPKVGTNLRDIIGLILKDMEGDEFDEYRERLERATNSLTEAQAQEQLLSNLAIAIGPSGNHDLSILSEAQTYLIESLPSLLFDPFFRQEYWLKDESIICKLARHILGSSASLEVVDEVRQFSIEDLPTSILDVKKASKQAEGFYRQLVADDLIKKETVEWLNAHLYGVISKVLNLGQEDLFRLMLDVRRTLARQGIELILLIEDFAKLQGIDREILEAIIAKGNDLCIMRTALACTEGYFKTALDDTVQTRVDFTVNLDVKTIDEQSLITPADVQQLVARYLNAVRLQESDILGWLASVNEETGEPLEAIPSACTDCEHQSSCHTGFGAVDGIGLYPFSATALEKMRKRTSTGVFNPRTLIKDVLRHTLEYHRSDLETGRFPSPLLLQHFGGNLLSVIVVREIDNKDTFDDARRREALLNLWSDSQELCNLQSEIHAAFDIPLLDIQPDSKKTKNTKWSEAISTTSRSTIPIIKEISSEITPDDEEFNIPEKLAEKLQALDRWSDQNPLPQLVSQSLYGLIHKAIRARIDWDTNLLLSSNFIPGFFKAGTNIHFQNDFKGRKISLYDKPRKGINLVLPLKESDLRDTALALQGILLYDHYKSWQFKDGSTYFQIYARKLEEWSDYILEEILKLSSKSRSNWNPIPATVEILAITGCMSGYITRHTNPSLEDLVNAVFVDLENVDVTDRSGTWQKLFNNLKKHQLNLRQIIESRIPCTKGGSPRLQVIDAVQLVGPLKAVSSTWKPQVDISDVSADSPFDAISKARKDVDELLEQAVRDERDRHLVIYQRILKELGENFFQKEVVDELQATIKQIQDAGVAGGVNLNHLNTAMDEFKKANLKAYINSLERLQEIEQDNIVMLLPLLSTLRERPVEVTTNFLDVACKFVDNAKKSAQNSLENLKTTQAGELEESCQNIETHLIKLQNLANDIKGELVCS